MFTVLIAEKEHIDAIRRDNALFFEPFLNNRELAFCRWIPGGETLDEAVPDLTDAVGRRKEWRALIVSDCSEEARRRQNPFDLADRSGLSALETPAGEPETDKDDMDRWLGEWEKYFAAVLEEKEKAYRFSMGQPLQKLTTWLCFQPEEYILSDVEDQNRDVTQWALDRISTEDMKPSYRLEQMERNQYKAEARLKETIRREFMGDQYLTIAHPAEVICVAPRTLEKSFFDPGVYWNARQVTDYSAFTDRNMYFDKLRFLVFDLLPRGHRDFRNDYIRFLATVLILGTNPLPGGALQPRRLYVLETKTDETPLCTLVTSYDRKLSETLSVIDSEMERIRGEIPGELSDKDAEALFLSPIEIPVNLDESCDPDKVPVDDDYGLFYDSPENELYKWNAGRRASDKALAYIVKQQSRALKKGTNKVRLAEGTSDMDVSRLTAFQIEDVRDHTNAAEDEMVASIPPDLSKMEKHREKLDRRSETVKAIIGKRMTGGTAVALGAACLVLFFACFLPFLLGNNATRRSVTTALLLSLGMTALLALALFISLLIQRAELRREVGGYNGEVREVLSDIKSGLKAYSKYLGAAYSVRRGHAVLNCAGKDLDQYTKRLRIRKKHQDDIRKRRAILREDYADYVGGPSFCDETMSRPYDYDFDQQTEYEYPAPFLAGDSRQIEFISGGNTVTVPSSYVTGILAKMEGIYEK